MQKKSKSIYISAITARIFHDEKMGDFVTWTAYSCDAKKSYVPRDFYFLAPNFEKVIILL